MITDIKEMLIKEPSSIVSLLEEYNFCHINLKTNEIRFARNEEGGQNISIRLTDNDGIYVKDFVTEDSLDIVAYIMKHRNVNFRTVLSSIKKILDLEDDWKPKETQKVFCGIYDSIGTDREIIVDEYPESIMDSYAPYGNKRWIKDGINLKTQEKFGVKYDVNSDLIVFPWRSATSGRIIAVKARINYPKLDDGVKYFYPMKGPVSNSLYGYSENYADLLMSDKVIVVEGEKSVMLIDQWGLKNAVAIGSHSLSDQQAKLIMSLSPKEVWFMLDKDLPIEETTKNILTLQRYMVMRETKIKYWNWEDNTTVREKGSPVDEGEFVFNSICEKEMREV